MTESETITFNGEEWDRDTFSSAVAMAKNSTEVGRGGLGGADVTRNPDVLRRFGQQYNGDRDIQQVLGYDDLEDDTALERYRAKYERQDIAKRVVDIFPDETWKDAPEVVDEANADTDFESTTNTFINTTLNHYFHRVDKAQRLGEYGVLVFGFNDGQRLDQPVNESALNSTDDIAYINVHPQEEVEDWTLGKEVEDGDHSEATAERYNKPVKYYIDFGDVDAENVDDEFKWVHWTRVFPHVAEDNLETDLKGTPALKPIYNRLDDLQKTVGASAEMFWTGANPKYVASVRDDFALQQFSDTGERENFKADFQRLVNELQNYLVTSGMEIEEFGGQEVDPSGVIDNIIQMISSSTKIPKNKLLGNEMGERATTQDRANWFDTISSRRTNFAIPTVIRPTLDRLVAYGILPEPQGGDYAIEFPELNQPTEAQQAETQAQRANTLSGSQLSMTLGSEAKMEYIETGEFPDMEPATETPVDESDDNVIDAFSNFTNQDSSIDFLEPEVDLVPPEAAQRTAQSVLDARDDPGKQVKGLTRTVEAIADIIASGETLTPEGVNDVFEWFSNHPQEESEIPQIVDWWRSRPVVAEKAYGGEPMREWVADTRRKLVTAGELQAEESPMAVGNQDVDLTPPESAQNNAQKVLDWRDDEDKEVSGMTETGWNRAEQLASGEELSPQDIKEIFAWFARHGPEEGELNDADMDPWEDNGRVAILGWGGESMRSWVEGKRSRLTELGELEPVNNDLAEQFAANARRYSEGDTVSTPNGVGVVADIITESVESDGETIEASDSSPTYIVLTESPQDGFNTYKASDLKQTTFAEEVENPEADLEEIANNSQSRLDVIAGLLTGNQDGRFEWPQSWVDSDTPARVIALKAYAGMGASFDGCVREMRGNVTRPEAFCGDFIDRLVGNPYWRGDSPLPGD